MNNIKGKKIAFIATDGVEEIELTRPWQAVQDAGAEPVLLSLETGTIQGFKHLTPDAEFDVDGTVRDADIKDYDGLVLPGGVANPDSLRQDEDAVSFIRDFVDSGKPIAAICHAPWTLVETDRVRGLTLTSFPSLKTDIENAGGNWVDKEVVVDNGIVTSRNPDDLDAFCKKMIEEFAEGKHTRHLATA